MHHIDWKRFEGDERCKCEELRLPLNSMSPRNAPPFCLANPRLYVQQLQNTLYHSQRALSWFMELVSRYNSHPSVQMLWNLGRVIVLIRTRQEGTFQVTEATQKFSGRTRRARHLRHGCSSMIGMRNVSSHFGSFGPFDEPKRYNVSHQKAFARVKDEKEGGDRPAVVATILECLETIGRYGKKDVLFESFGTFQLDLCIFLDRAIKYIFVETT
ncbi:hypothetical protein BWQ96_07510 [Gracilariopsis chorda]|uniref:Uncharacterized protein n=1 Tax=Gracilariopsis chorda TaxID=448386 RepID=A0A2V3IL23_9FLOR|nr:hypothetical protein BWQ96_07510 [Gracilariopsis chorda]|eukprot:PXF42758.1 hypothetical protein BWQ96_07510 [Gracilariopsis chorda]